LDELDDLGYFYVAQGNVMDKDFLVMKK